MSAIALTVKEQGRAVGFALDDTLRELDKAFAELTLLEGHPDEPSTVYLRDKLESARKALEEAMTLSENVTL